MAVKKITKKKYLKVLNKRLRDEPDVSSDALFVFYPLGTKAKHATGVTVSERCGERELAVMAAIQRKAASEFTIAGGEA